jgi:excisionase family DNA binding protein
MCFLRMQEILYELRRKPRMLTMPRRVSLPTVVDNVPALFPPGDHRKTINVKELSELTGIEGPTLRDWVRRGIIPGAFQRKDHGKWRFRREMLAPWWEELLSRHILR